MLLHPLLPLIALGLAVPGAQAQSQVTLLARSLAATCATCHGTDGAARSDFKPLAGVPAERVVAMLRDYRSGVLPGTVMPQIAKGYSDEQIALVATYFASRRVQP
jgi:cytochrome subunit of sulfide dehydrogenase